MLQIGHGRLRHLAKEPERRFGLNVELDVGEAQELTLLIQHRPSPDVQRRIGAGAEKDRAA